MYLNILAILLVHRQYRDSKVAFWRFQVSVALPFMEGHTEAKNAVALAIMILILLFRPQGIFGQKERIS